MSDKDIPLELYKQIHKTMPIPCVDIVLMNKGKVLLVTRMNEPAKGLRWLVGGRVLKGETLKDAVLRKVRQEAGIEVKNIRFLGTEETIFDKGPFGWETHTINSVYVAEPKGKINLKADDQHEKFEWVAGIKKDFHPYIKKYITLAKKVYEKKR